MSEPTEGLRWIANRREDGVEIVERNDGSVLDTCMIVTPWGASLTECPCCNLPFRSKRAARLVADMIYPIQRVV
jgi:hypothetical protein